MLWKKFHLNSTTPESFCKVLSKNFDGGGGGGGVQKRAKILHLVFHVLRVTKHIQSLAVEFRKPPLIQLSGPVTR